MRLFPDASSSLSGDLSLGPFAPRDAPPAPCCSVSPTFRCCRFTRQVDRDKLPSYRCSKWSDWARGPAAYAPSLSNRERQSVRLAERKVPTRSRHWCPESEVRNLCGDYRSERRIRKDTRKLR